MNALPEVQTVVCLNSAAFVMSFEIVAGNAKSVSTQVYPALQQRFIDLSSIGISEGTVCVPRVHAVLGRTLAAQEPVIYKNNGRIAFYDVTGTTLIFCVSLTQVSSQSDADFAEAQLRKMLASLSSSNTPVAGTPRLLEADTDTNSSLAGAIPRETQRLAVALMDTLKHKWAANYASVPLGHNSDYGYVVSPEQDYDAAQTQILDHMTLDFNDWGIGKSRPMATQMANTIEKNIVFKGGQTAFNFGNRNNKVWIVGYASVILTQSQLGLLYLFGAAFDTS